MNDNVILMLQIVFQQEMTMVKCMIVVRFQILMTVTIIMSTNTATLIMAVQIVL